MTSNPKKNNNKSHILLRYSVISAFFLFIAALIVFKLVDNTIIEAPDWNARAKKELEKVKVIAPERGNILAANGNILACNLRVHDIMLDFSHPKIRRMKNISQKSIDSLADSLDVYYPRRSDLMQLPPDSFEVYSWHTRLREEIEKTPAERTTCLRLAKKKSMADYNRIRNFPFLRTIKGAKGRIPLYTNDRNVRIYPYGRMAYRSVGRVNERKSGEFHGYSGLEKDLDSLLYGVPGKTRRVMLTSGLTDWVDVAPQRGFDILTTIDIDMQDMLEEELLRVCQEAKAEWGTAILMEVATGEIKALSNIELLDDGTYGEALNRAVQAYEPGSVMKPISLMIAFEDGLVHSVNDVVSCAPFMRTSDPHGSGAKTMKQVIEQSSNPGIARVIFRGYAADPARFYDRLKSIGFFDRMHSGIADEARPRVRRLEPTDDRGNPRTMTARHLDLARQTYGYNTEIPPIYTLAYYNAIANGGRMMRPHLVRALRLPDGRDSILKLPPFPDSVCSAATAAKVRECIREVVWGSHGTARKVQDDRVEIAGKTGTAYPVEKFGYNLSKRRYAFAGFFPYSAPRYSCMALVLAPSGTSAASTSGQVVKNVALKLYSRGMLGNTSSYAATRTASAPLVAASGYSDNSRVARELGTSSMRRARRGAATAPGTIPDVRGCDAPTAIRELEKLGYNVRLAGSGMVRAQSAPPGSRLKKGSIVKLTLKP